MRPHPRVEHLRFAVTERPGPVFGRLLAEQDYQGAWMSLNSRGWRFLQAKDALRRLAARVNIPGFDLLAAAWTAAAHERNGRTPETAGY